MGKKRKTEVKVNDTESLQALMQETYVDACLQISDSQKTINELTTAATPEGVTDLATLAKEKAGLLKVKDSAIKIKLELAKLQSDIIKSRGNVDEALSERSGGAASLNDFKSIREMFKNKDENNSEKSGE